MRRSGRNWSYRLAVALGSVLAVVVPAAVLGPAAVAQASGYLAVSAQTNAGADVVPAPAMPAFDECGFTSSSVKRLVRPKSVIIACGDANTRLDNLKWSSWGTATAAATGQDTWNTCVPYCAASKKWDSTAATVTLSHPVATSHGPLFGLLTVHTAMLHAPGSGSFVFLPETVACNPSNRAWAVAHGYYCHSSSPTTTGK